jgi:hypothetical protein
MFLVSEELRYGAGSCSDRPANGGSDPRDEAADRRPYRRRIRRIHVVRYVREVIQETVQQAALRAAVTVGRADILFEHAFDDLAVPDDCRRVARLQDRTSSAAPSAATKASARREHPANAHAADD